MLFLKRWSYAILGYYRTGLTGPGKALFWLWVATALAGLDTQVRHVYILFSITTGLFIASLLSPLRFRPDLSVKRRLPSRVGAGEETSYQVTLESAEKRPLGHLFLEIPEAIGGTGNGKTTLHVKSLKPKERLVLSHTVKFPQRGAFYDEGVFGFSLLPFGLIRKPVFLRDPRKVVVYPKVYPIHQLSMSSGRRYHSGGIVVASSTGDSVEFIGTREYQEGDPLKKIHWPSWARTGKPIVKEYQEEYFVRHALIMDTFVTDPASEEESLRFEAAISLTASISSHISLQDFIVDIFAAGPRVYYFSAGRSLAHLDNILEILATIEPNSEAPFLNFEPLLMERLGMISSILMVLIDMDPRREDLLMRLKLLGVPIKVLHLYSTESEPAPPDFLNPETEYRPIAVHNLEEEVRML